MTEVIKVGSQLGLWGQMAALADGSLAFVTSGEIFNEVTEEYTDYGRVLVFDESGNLIRTDTLYESTFPPGSFDYILMLMAEIDGTAGGGYAINYTVDFYPSYLEDGESEMRPGRWWETMTSVRLPIAMNSFHKRHLRTATSCWSSMTTRATACRRKSIMQQAEASARC